MASKQIGDIDRDPRQQQWDHGGELREWLNILKPGSHRGTMYAASLFVRLSALYTLRSLCYFLRQPDVDKRLGRDSLLAGTFRELLC